MRKRSAAWLGRTEEATRTILEALGEDIKRPGIAETPLRFAKALEFWTSGYESDPGAVIKQFEDADQSYDEMVVMGNISVYSLCEHHLAPFFGVAHVAYIPNGKVVGLSKMPRLVEVFSRRLQMQERIGCQIADAMMEHLKPKAVGVVLRCRHLCVESRGVQKSGTATFTSALRGSFKDDPSARSEFMDFVKMADSGGKPI